MLVCYNFFMRKVCRLLSLIFLLGLLSACATTRYYANAVNSWQGASEKQVYRVWGYPNKVMDLPNKHKVLVYHEEERGFDPIYSSPSNTEVTLDTSGNTKVFSYGGRVSGGGSYDYQCTTWFELNKKGRVVNTKFRGNHCLATKESMMRYTYKGF